MTNVYANTPQVLVAIKNATMTEIGFDSSNLEIIYEVNADLKSYQPNRTINSFFNVHVDFGYYIITKVDMDLSTWFAPPTGNLSKAFLDLIDVIPTDFTGQAGKLVMVNDTEDGLIFGEFESGTEVVKTASVTVGGISAGQNYTIGTIATNKDTLSAMLTKIYYPSFSMPSYGLINSSGLQIISSTIDLGLSFIFNRGSINGALSSGIWNPSTSQGSLAGAATSYHYFEADGTTTIAGSSATTTKTNHVVIQGNNVFKASVDYGIGIQPEDSTGANYSTPYAAGNSGLYSTSFEGVYPLFATTSSINTLTQQGLLSMISANNIELNLVSESGGDKQAFQIANVWLTVRPLTAIYYFNTVSNQYDTTNKISDFTTSTVSETLVSNSVAYTNYLNNTANRGAIKIKLVF